MLPAPSGCTRLRRAVFVFKRLDQRVLALATAHHAVDKVLGNRLQDQTAFFRVRAKRVPALIPSSSRSGAGIIIWPLELATVKSVSYGLHMHSVCPFGSCWNLLLYGYFSSLRYGAVHVMGL